jgi:hypothetical protein
MDPEKVAAVQAWPRPHTARALQGILGLTRYYRKFIAGYGAVAACDNPIRDNSVLSPKPLHMVIKR